MQGRPQTTRPCECRARHKRRGPANAEPRWSEMRSVGQVTTAHATPVPCACTAMAVRLARVAMDRVLRRFMKPRLANCTTVVERFEQKILACAAERHG